MEKIKKYFLEPHFHFSRIQFNLVTILFISIGLFGGSYLTLKGIGSIFASANSSVSKDSDTDFSQGTLSSTVVSGTGAGAVIQLTGTTGPDGTLYKRAITITNNSVSTLTDYQISLTLDTASLLTAGKMHTNCPDIRFTDSDDVTNISNYWIENCNSASSIIWVKVPSSPGIYYKNYLSLLWQCLSYDPIVYSEYFC